MDPRALQFRMRRLFREGFTAMDLAEPLLSFDFDTDALAVKTLLDNAGTEIAGVRVGGRVNGYVHIDDLRDGPCGRAFRPFEENEVLQETEGFPETLEALDQRDFVFVSILGEVAGTVKREAVQSPVFRMWLFGMVTIIEMFVSRKIDELFPDESWKAELSEGRLLKASQLQAERLRRGEPVRLVECLQLGDKAWIIFKDPQACHDAGFASRLEAKRAVKEFESLRNNLAHSQDIGYNWTMIVRLAGRLDRVMGRV